MWINKSKKRTWGGKNIEEKRLIVKTSAEWQKQSKTVTLEWTHDLWVTYGDEGWRSWPTSTQDPSELESPGWDLTNREKKPTQRKLKLYTFSCLHAAPNQIPKSKSIEKLKAEEIHLSCFKVHVSLLKSSWCINSSWNTWVFLKRYLLITKTSQQTQTHQVSWRVVWILDCRDLTCGQDGHWERRNRINRTQEAGSPSPQNSSNHSRSPEKQADIGRIWNTTLTHLWSKSDFSKSKRCGKKAND